MEMQEILFALIRTVICGQSPDTQLKNACTPEALEAVYQMASRHDLAHLVGQAIARWDLPPSEILTKSKEAAKHAFLRSTLLAQACDRACACLEAAGIPFIPLKGAVLRAYYPNPWMRTSCDVDILVHREDLAPAVKCLVQQLHYTEGQRGDHDISLWDPNGLHLELHYDTIQARYEYNGCRDVLAKIWEQGSPKKPGSCHFCLTDEMFYFYHMAHMAKHFTTGGCGVRAFLDIWIMNNKMRFSEEKRTELLKAGGLLSFARGAEKLSRVWFSGEKPEKMDEALSDYILRATLYGDRANRAAVGQAKSGGKLKYLRQRAFLPYPYLKAEYPILEKQKWLTPFFQMVRWGRMLLRGEAKRTMRELKANTASRKDDIVSATELLQYLGL